MFQSGQLVRVNLAGLQAEGVTKYLVKLLFSFRGVSEVEVPADRIHGQVTVPRTPRSVGILTKVISWRFLESLCLRRQRTQGDDPEQFASEVATPPFRVPGREHIKL